MPGVFNEVVLTEGIGSDKHRGRISPRCRIFARGPKPAGCRGPQGVSTGPVRRFGAPRGQRRTPQLVDSVCIPGMGASDQNHFRRRRSHHTTARRRMRLTRANSCERMSRPSGIIQIPKTGKNQRQPPIRKPTPIATLWPRERGMRILRPNRTMVRGGDSSCSTDFMRDLVLDARLPAAATHDRRGIRDIGERHPQLTFRFPPKKFRPRFAIRIRFAIGLPVARRARSPVAQR